MNRIVVAIAALALIGGAAYVLRSPRNRSSADAPPGRPASTPAPDFALRDYQGDTVRLSQFRGTPVIVNSWASWCPFCVDELPDFAAVQDEFGDRAAVIAVNRAESPDVAQRFSDQVGVTGRFILLLDPGDSFYRSIGGFSMPETIFVDAEGNIRDHKRGPMTSEEIRQRLAAIL